MDNGVNAQFVGLNNPENVSIEKLINGEIDALVTTDAYEDEYDHATLPIVKIGQSNFFFAVNKNRPDLLNELNFAMSKINDENRFYNDHLYSKYLKGSGTNAFISNEELNWLAQHGTIRVGYLNNFDPFCNSSMTGGVEGVLNVIKDGVEQYEMIRIVDTYFGEALDRINLVSVGFAEVDSEIRELMEQNRILSESLRKAQTTAS